MLIHRLRRKARASRISWRMLASSNLTMQAKTDEARPVETLSFMMTTIILTNFARTTLGNTWRLHTSALPCVGSGMLHTDHSVSGVKLTNKCLGVTQQRSPQRKEMMLLPDWKCTESGSPGKSCNPGNDLLLWSSLSRIFLQDIVMMQREYGSPSGRLPWSSRSRGVFPRAAKSS